jgi:5-methylcytosine-specific restriction protein A
MCEQRGRIVAASVVDHIQPHKGNVTLFWDATNLQALCKGCHDSAKAMIERGDKVPPHASWNRAGLDTGGDLARKSS